MEDRSLSKPLLPLELLELIIDAILQMAGGADTAIWALSHLSQTCHFMADLCRPYMFHTFTMLRRPSEPHLLFARFYKLLTSTAPHLARHVRSATIFQNEASPGNPLATPHLSYILGSLPNLTHLSIMSRFTASWESFHPEVRKAVSNVVHNNIQHLKMVEISCIPGGLFQGCRKLIELDFIGCTLDSELPDLPPQQPATTVTRLSLVNTEATFLLRTLGLGESGPRSTSNPISPSIPPQLTSLTASLGASFVMSELWSLIERSFLSLTHLDLQQRLRAWEVEEGHVRGPSPIDCSPIHPIGPLTVLPRLPLLTDLSVTLVITNIPPYLDPSLPKPKLEDLRDHPFYDLCHILQVLPQQLERFHLTLDFTLNPDRDVHMEEVFDHPVMDWFYGKRTVLWPEIDYSLSNRQHLPRLRRFELTVLLDDPVDEYGWELDPEEHVEELNEFADHLSALIDRRLPLTKERVGERWEVNILFE